MISIATLERDCTLEEAYVRVGDLDLTRVREKLCDPVEADGKGWTVEQVELTEREYVRFLILNLVADSGPVVPSHAVDEFWHAHILDTRAYIDDTNRIFGRVLHHNPYFGRSSDSEATELRDAYQCTLDWYEVYFGAAPKEIWSQHGGPTCKAIPPKPPPGPPRCAAPH